MNVELLKKRIKILESDNLNCTLDLLELRKEQGAGKNKCQILFSDALLARAKIRNVAAYVARVLRETYLTKNLTCLWTACFIFEQPSPFLFHRY